ncbi:transcription factor Spi-C isoform X2 [Pogona vitticeps]
MSFSDQELLGQALEDALEIIQQHSDGDFDYVPEDYKSCLMYHHYSLQENPSSSAESPTEKPKYSWKNRISEEDLYPNGGVYCTLQNLPESQMMSTVTMQQKGSKGKRKPRLFEYIHESLHNPDLANCIQWIDKPNGVFQFVSKNKEKLAERWGECKGNRKTMTYQKMARALRNYGRTGEIIKIRRKLTYQFGAGVLQRLSPACFLEKDGDVEQYAGNNQGWQYSEDLPSYHSYLFDGRHDLQQVTSNTIPFCYGS